MAGGQDWEQRIDELYAGPPGEFTKARNALARTLSAGGDKEAAAAVKALRKPSMTAWALDRAARAHPDAVANLAERARALRDAHQAALRGEATDLRAAGRQHQDAIAEVVRLAIDELAGAGERAPSPSQRERLAETLRAVTSDDEAFELLRRGRLAGDLEAVGFGGEETGPPAARPASRPAEQQDRAAVVRGQARDALERAERQADEAEAEAERLEAAARAAGEQAEAVAAELQRANDELRQARQAAIQARRLATQAGREVERARHRLGPAGG
jgi:hypothetical protein